MAQRGQLIGIATHAVHRGPMEQHSSVGITTQAGVGADVRGKPGRRQATVITSDSWRSACAEAGAELPWTTRRANLLVDGIDLRNKVGYDLHIGDVMLTITGETRPCSRMDEARPGLRRALEPGWRGGVTCMVIRSGHVQVGQQVMLRRVVVRQVALAARARVRTLVRRGRAFAGQARVWLRELRGV